ncbi:MAG: hypothetical protein ACK4RW_10965 [Rehaibacterium terrae]|uniref:hypothetical protein n=1 Tax=Rehaibacterium terrae TaxID=1341696 RepID=UPI00391A56AF
MRRIALLAALLLPAAALPAQEFSSLEERMTGAEFKAAGLDKLSPEELAALNAWLRRQAGTALPVPPGATPPAIEDRTGFRSESPRGIVVSRIDGDFNGWEGRAVFRLQNGQVWQSIEPGARFHVPRTMVNPEVRIQSGMFGGWYLSVEGYNTRVRVQRIQ